MINGHHIQMAEQKLAGSVQMTHDVVETDRALFMRANVERESFERLLKHHWEAMHERLPDLDPRLQPFMNTHLRHFFLIGAMAERERADGA